MLEALAKMFEELASENLSNPYFSAPIYLAAGLLSSLFPCSYPLIPITAGYLRSRAAPGEKLYKHPLLYWCGTVSTYGILGATAAVGGGAFNKIAQSEITLIAVGFFFLFLALATLDWFPLSSAATAGLYDKLSRKKGALFSLFMGALAALLISACAAPVLVAMLVMLAQQGAAVESTLGSALWGSALSLSYGSGVATPLLLIGLLSSKIPKGGSWGKYIKFIFAVGIGVVGLHELATGFSLLGLSDQQVYAVLIGIILLFLAVLLGLSPPSPKDRRASVKFYFALLSLAFGLALIINGVTIVENGNLSPGAREQHQHQHQHPTGTQTPQQGALQQSTSSGSGIPSASSSSADSAASETIASETAVAKTAVASYELIGGLRFYRQYEHAQKLARLQNRPIFIDFYGEWCANCKAFNRQIETDRRLQQALAPAILLKIYDTDVGFRQFAERPDLPELRIGLPFFAVLEPDGSLRWKTTNHTDIAGMASAIANHPDQNISQGN